MKQNIKFLFAAFIFILCMSTNGFSEDNDIFGECSTTVEPNILVVIDSSGSMGTSVGGSTRIAIARQAVKNIIDEYAGNNRFGIMRFNTYEGGRILAGCASKDNYILDGNGDLKTGADYDTAIADYKTYLKGVVDTVPASGYTPLAETLFEAGRYFAGEASEFNSGTYTSPQEYRCRKNYIILMTDGAPTQDGDRLEGELINGINIDNYETDLYGGSYDSNDPELHNVAELLFENDINDALPAAGVTTFVKQNVLTYPIGFGDSLNATNIALLQDTADKGQGVGVDEGLLGDATTATDLEGVFKSIMAEIEEKKTTFAAPIVPISASSNAYAGDYVYLSMFKPDDDNSQWVGNLKKYALNDDNQFISEYNNEAILDANGLIKDDARSCWSSSNDGPYVAKGGAGARILADSSRNIIYNDTSGTGGFLAFNSTNLDDSDFSFVPGDISLSDFIDKISMVNEDPTTGWKLYDLNHSKPAIANLNGGDYLFVGSNGGMLHCISDSSGDEIWAFVPKEQFNRLDKVYSSADHYHFMDGSPTVANLSGSDNYDDAVIIGERRGGNRYYAIDFSTNILSPSYKYTYTVEGQSWKKPDSAKFKTSAAASPTNAFMLTGGYDERYDHSDDLMSEVNAVNTDADLTNDVDEVKGGQIHIINAATGAELLRLDSSDQSNMKASIVAAWAVDVVDNDNDAITQIYAGDMEGNIFAFRDNDPAAGNALDGTWQANHLFQVTGSTTGKKIFKENDFVQEFIYYYDTANNEWKEVVGDFTYFGTGDRADPLDNYGSLKTNYFYCVKNDWITEGITTAKTVDDYSTLDEDSGAVNSNEIMVDVTNYNIVNGEIPTAIAHLDERYNRGWYIELEGDGEKCLSTPIVYAGIVYFTTYTPPADSGNTDPCGTSLIGGTAQLYALDYKTGGAVYNFDGSASTDLTKADRSITLSTQNITIPTDPVIIITDSGDKLFVGPEEFDIDSPNDGVDSFYWKTVR